MEKKDKEKYSVKINYMENDGENWSSRCTVYITINIG